MNRRRIVYVIKNLSLEGYLKSFNGIQFEFTNDISEAKYFKSESDAWVIAKTTIMGVQCLPHCVPVNVKISEVCEDDEEEDED